jgi:hypothetical protein
MQALTASNSDMDLNPLIRTALSTSRAWTDANHDYVPECDLTNPAANGECGAMVNANFGKTVFQRTFDPNFINGWGKRPYNWELGASVQQEIAPRVGLTVGYYRRWFGNFYTLNNTAVDPSQFTPFSIPIPVDPHLPGGGGGTLSGLYNVIPGKVGAIQEYATLASNLGPEPTENWQGIDISVNARLRTGLTVQGGTSTGRTLQDNCGLRSVLPETYPWATIDVWQSLRGNTTDGLVNPYCRIVTPYLTSLRGIAAYVIPKVGIQVSGTLRSDPGVPLVANYTVTSAIAAPSLGRSLSSGNVSVNLIAPGTLYSARQNNVDFRVAKNFRFGRTRTLAGVDVYNVLNTDVATTFNPGYVPNVSFAVPATITPARYAKLFVQMDF